jgi:hypothetical protein
MDDVALIDAHGERAALAEGGIQLARRQKLAAFQSLEYGSQFHSPLGIYNVSNVSIEA